jgi:dienelactone hydrolase
VTRRQLLALAAAPYPGLSYRDYSRCLRDYLRDLADRAYRKRNSEIEKLTTSGAITARQRWVRDTLWKLAGGMPERTPLNARTLGSFDRSGYRVERILYESQPRFHIPANLYIPTKGSAPFPGVLFQMGHSLNGKANDSYQNCCQGLAQLGYLVLAFDPMGQGERTYYPEENLSRTRLSSADEEHTLPGKQMLLYGDTSTRLQVWDAVRSLDYLAAHPQVDPKRLAATGQSGGATLTMLLAAVDDRLAAAVVCMGNTENFACADFNPPGSTDDAEQDFIGSGPEGFDRWDLLYPLAPKSLLVIASDKDAFGTYSPRYISSGWEEYGKLKKVYERLGHGDRLAWADTPLPHGLSYDTRLRVYNWFERWLKPEHREISEEPAVSPEPDRNLWVASSGNVVKTFGGETPFSLNRSRQVARQPMALDRLLAMERPSDVRPTVLRRAPSRNLDIEALEIPSDPKVWVPAWLFISKKPDASKPALLVLEPAGRNIRWREGELYQTVAAQGGILCAPDLRGIGDLAPEFGRGSAHYNRSHEDEEDYAWASLILGRPLAGQRVRDILSVVRALRAHPALAGRKLTVAAQGKMTVPALFAAALEPSIDALYLSDGLISFRNIVDAEQFTHSFANFVPNLLRHLDLPDVAASIAPRRVTIAGAVDGSGRLLDLPVARAAYQAAANVTLLPKSRWDATGFYA